MPAPPARDHFDYAIVGMGIGGLTLGALLAQADKRVIIFEQHEVPGGYGHTFRAGRFSFCAELHYVWDCGRGERVYRMLKKLGLETQVTFHQLDPAGFDRIVGPGVDYAIGCGFQRELDRLGQLFPQHAEGLEKYYRIIDTIHRQMYQLPIGFDGRTIFGHPQQFSHIIRYLRWTLEDLFDQLGFPPPLRLILAGQSAIFWLPPRDLSLVVHAAGVGSYNQGAYYPRQSFMHVMKSLLRHIKKHPGCRSLLATEVTGMEVRDGRLRSLVTAAGQRYTADQFLFDGDAQLTLDLIGPQHFPAAFRRKLQYDYGTSVVSVYLGLRDYDLRRAGFGEQNIFWHPKVNLNEVYDDQLADRIPPSPFFFCNAPTLRPHDPHLAPPGGHQLVMVAPCSYQLFRRLREASDKEYQAAKQEFANRIIQIVESRFAPGLSDHIEVKVVGSPLTNEFYVRAPKGNCYSTPLDPQHVNLRRLNYQSPFPNLYYVGASSCLPGFATIIHFACLLYEKLTGDQVD
ncbi:MAG: NAD(P)-binding protein [Planctomycetales bacterium]|nr:NAD(P)-binding protein [Planctomycetales bacterium]NIM08205.1 NAD(P)-binding protein [Planctomycetales bacterium]NIN07699.1 NAD(P)-binding protein [Planctomycetales bacterium]NIN76825.1 NAD(P)-binding protein [Planctomycetales bacterium]NIO34021.1 NAD(P)-binding protein [Planctomycetales bacterium]